ncbi:MAG: c-type cytochrome domain-containing protein [Vicinamibacterales bacterium]
MFEWRLFLGPFHSVLLHFPIGALAITFLLDLYVLFRPSAEARRLVGAALSVSVASTVVVAIFGLWRSTAGGYNEAALTQHLVAGLALIGLATATLIAQRVAFAYAAGPVARMVYRGLFLVVLAAVVATGHSGGELAHGSRYLVENAPPALKRIIEPAAVAAPGSAEPTLYATTIRPVLESKCYRCHGPQKQEYGLRLDRREAALAGGASGRPALVPGKPMQSEIVRRLLLPPGAGGAMPPAGMARPDADEVLAIAAWIHDGAPFDGAPEGSR